MQKPSIPKGERRYYGRYRLFLFVNQCFRFVCSLSALPFCTAGSGKIGAVLVH